MIDGAHNANGAHALAEAVRELFPGRRATLVFGLLKDKAISDILEEILPLADRVVISRPINARAADPVFLRKEVADWLSTHGRHEVAVKTEENIERAVDIALEETGEDGLILITGSLYLVGYARRRVLVKIHSLK